jgi:putative (di)nucleoside polyphosphate hydrolase
VIDSQGYRANVGIILCNREGRLLWARRLGQNSWQFPQGGIKRHESAEQALFRELHEEIGLMPEQVEIVASTRGWLRYRLPRRYIRFHNRPVCIGQKQRWFLLRLLAEDDAVRLDLSDKPEFEEWRWVNYWYPLEEIVFFKRRVYERALRELERSLFPDRRDGHRIPSSTRSLTR